MPGVIHARTLANKHMHLDGKKRRSFLALFFAAGDVKRYAPKGTITYGI